MARFIGHAVDRPFAEKRIDPGVEVEAEKFARRLVAGRHGAKKFMVAKSDVANSHVASRHVASRSAEVVNGVHARLTVGRCDKSRPMDASMKRLRRRYHRCQ